MERISLPLRAFGPYHNFWAVKTNPWRGVQIFKNLLRSLSLLLCMSVLRLKGKDYRVKPEG